MIEIISFVLAAVLLSKTADKTIEYGIDISKIFNLSTFIVGFIFVAVGTSLPEILVAISASVKDQAALSVGNIVGSNLANITLVLGLGVLLGGTLKFKKDEKGLIEPLIVSAIIAFVLIYMNILTIIHGLILILLFTLLVNKTYKKNKIVYKLLEERFTKKDKIKVIVKFLLSLVLVLISSEILVRSAIAIAESFNLDIVLVGATITAIGTSLPELSVQIKAIKKKQSELAMGNILGSCLTNITLVLGLTAIFSKTGAVINGVAILVPFILISSLLLWNLIEYNKEIKKRDAWLMIIIYFLFILQYI
jgi:cation:H+ antiporter